MNATTKTFGGLALALRAGVRQNIRPHPRSSCGAYLLCIRGHNATIRGMKIFMNTGGLAATNAYLVADDTMGQAAVIDAPRKTLAPLLRIAAKHHWTITYLLLTHGHWDHIGDHKVLTDAWPQAKVLIHRLDEPKLLKPGSRFYPLKYVIPARRADGYLEDGQTITVGKVQLEVLHTPGHSPGHVALYCRAERELFAGDLLFTQSIGRTDLPDSSPADMRRSLQRILQLPQATVVRPGHGAPTTLRTERSENPFLTPS